MSAAARASAAAMIERTKVSLNARALSMPHLRTALGVVQGELICRQQDRQLFDNLCESPVSEENSVDYEFETRD
jgi:hypothetical protein